MESNNYDIIVVGAGHAGCEAAASAARLGSKTLLITMNMTTMAQMSCNPSIGGIAKGQIVREIDALGGYTGKVSDLTMIQFRMLNKSKGPAMWSPRSQNDRTLFSLEWRSILESIPSLFFWQDHVVDLIVEDKTVTGVRTAMGMNFKAKAVILANGTFLNGLIHIGEKQFQGGRLGEKPSKDLTENLISYGFEASRMKTGTPMRLDGRSLDFSRMDEQKGDENPSKFSYTDTPKLTHQKSCFLAYTNKEVHDILRTGFDKSPLFTGRIKGRGPRYCPSIEDKIERFSSRERHQLFIEPEGWNTVEYYLNGFSSSLPEDVQFKAIKKVPGFENARFFRPGYAIEYDYFPPYQLTFSLETKIIRNLFFAGQINGTTGYEEAAAQGLMAGINAHQKINGLPEFILKRSEAYIGVLIDDLITKGTDEPYRMFTSRAEYRILLRQDNADFRLTPLAYQLGMVGEDRMERIRSKYDTIKNIRAFLNEESVCPEEINSLLAEKNTALLSQKTKYCNVLLRPQISLKDIVEKVEKARNFISSFPIEVEEEMEEVEIQVKYEGYIEKEQELAEKLIRLEYIKIPPDFDFHTITSLSSEAREKLSRIRPSTIGQASRISGVSPADISILIVFLGR
ncbi:MAG TPA: tRNA uridine-5-carboxymethylaminomethyl(34) synthesis enzyme MnmG [Bacteroidales bacterium]|nr:tRNA uridine-5-carboxymethylaminomethyl(34) synthesis enzyme MnmG [Bacteroidales bacterium]HPS72945.1 tRNA uridine-5-carboxymethylaminomethyl(34) synthesis enzyme MnmG [Bacteroidales bacterium]